LGQTSNIYDVAAAAGVSIATVSRYLNNNSKVSASTREKLQKVISDMNYFPTGNMSPKAKRYLGRIGVLTPFFPSPSFVERIKGIAEVLHGTAYELLIYSVDSQEQLDEYLHSIPFTKRLDGLIIISLFVDYHSCERLLHSGLETVFIENGHPQFCSVVADNLRGGELAAQHLLEKKLTPCGFICEELPPSYSFQPARIRFEGFSMGLEAGGHPIRPEHIRYGEYSVESARTIAKEMLSRSDRPRSIFTYGDLQAVGVLKAAKDLGLRVPEDLGVIGFDDTEMADYMELTTISQALKESGRVAAETLLNRLKEPGRPAQEIQLPVKVVIRSTT